ncbi:HdeD family acid-resistance protein [Synechococcus sp. CCY 9618]|uniref:HdeD family acid-resistance protein n=1 Tax=Synechococcus sp. CCY 9618 TaxID=2815602 RepID=UPI001C24CB8C|nr:DUF308 domain-containing protein [Synechococcus sp. CCY 9618]
MPSPGTPPSRPAMGAALRAFTLAEGVMLLVLGVLAVVFPVLASQWVTAMVAIAFLVGGLVGWISSLLRSTRLSRAITFWRLVISTLFLVMGVWMIQQLASGPMAAAAQTAALALAIGVVFLVEGVVAILVSATHRQIVGWRWGLANGVVTLALGLLILTMKFWSLLWVVGTLVGISFLFSGIDLLRFSASFHPEED